MTSEAAIAANRLNSTLSTGPVTAAGKARVAQNSVTLGLFATRDLVLPEEQAEYDELRAALDAELIPATVMERTLAAEILHATWRLRRCSIAESNLGPDEYQQPSATQCSIDRARAHARNNLRRASADLSRLQTERHLKTLLPAEVAEPLVSQQTVTKTLASDTRRRLNLRKLDETDSFENILEKAAAQFHASITKQSHFSPPASMGGVGGSACPRGPGAANGSQPSFTA